MKKYYVNERGLNHVYDSEERAKKFAEKIGSKVEEKIYWQYFAPYYSGGNSGIRQITGKDFVSAIISNFDKIIHDYDLSGCAGYRLKFAELEKMCDGVDLVIDIVKLGKFERESERKSKRISIEGVEPADMAVDRINLLDK